MTIIADASPIIALHNIDKLDLLREVFGNLFITDIVYNEAGINLPDWIQVTSEYDSEKYEKLSAIVDPEGIECI